MAKKGEWVRIHKVVLAAAERTAKLPEIFSTLLTGQEGYSEETVVFNW